MVARCNCYEMKTLARQDTLKDWVGRLIRSFVFCPWCGKRLEE